MLTSTVSVKSKVIVTINFVDAPFEKKSKEQNKYKFHISRCGAKNSFEHFLIHKASCVTTRVKHDNYDGWINPE